MRPVSIWTDGRCKDRGIIFRYAGKAPPAWKSILCRVGEARVEAQSEEMALARSFLNRLWQWGTTAAMGFNPVLSIVLLWIASRAGLHQKGHRSAYRHGALGAGCCQPISGRYLHASVFNSSARAWGSTIRDAAHRTGLKSIRWITPQ